MTDWRKVQLRLKELGFDPGPIDGVRGPRTDAAIVAFKKSIGLRARPYFGPLTERALFTEVDKQADLPWMQAATDMMGIHEDRDTARLRKWFDRSVAWIDPRDVSWCGAFVQTCMKIAFPNIITPDKPLLARSWQSFGVSTHPSFGSVLVFWRGQKAGWQGHVGFYRAEDDTHFHVLGGNQSDSVRVTRIAKTRLLASRWPAQWPGRSNPIFVTPGGVPVSNNEA